MSEDFQEKLSRYKDGQLSHEEETEMEKEIDKFIAIKDYLHEDEENLIEGLKREIPQGIQKPKRLKSKVNLRIFMMTTFSVLAISTLAIFLVFLSSNIISSLFGLDQKEAYKERETITQLTKMFLPQFEVKQSGSGERLFAQEVFQLSLEENIGYTTLEKSEFTVNYSFGKPKNSENPWLSPPILEVDHSLFSTQVDHESYVGFNILEKAPEGTKAKILVEFTIPLTPEQVKESFMNSMNTNDLYPTVVTPLATVDSHFIIANPSYYYYTPLWPFDPKNATQIDTVKQEQYENMENFAHTDSFLGNLSIIKNNLSIIRVMYYNDMFAETDFDDIIKDVEDNGVKYIGTFITGDTKELLKLKNHPLIHCMSVKDIVVW